MTPRPRNATLAMGSFPRVSTQGASRLIDIEVEIFDSDLGKCAIGHARVERFLEHGFERLVLLAKTDADTVAEIGRIARHVGGEDAALRLLPGFYVIGERVLVADDGIEPPFGEIENGFLERCVGADFRMFVDIADIGFMGSARLDANGPAHEARRTYVQGGMLLRGHE